MLLSGNCSDITIISHDAEDLSYKTCSAMESTKQFPHVTGIHYVFEVKVQFELEKCSPYGNCMVLSLNKGADGGPLPAGGKVMPIVQTQKLECLPHLPSLQL